MAELSIPFGWSLPKFQFNQTVLVQNDIGWWLEARIIGLEYMDAKHYSVTRWEQPIGWKYILLVDSTDPYSKVEPILFANESQVTAMPSALVVAT